MSELTTPIKVSIWSYDGCSSRTDYFLVLLGTSVAGALTGLSIAKGGALTFFGTLLLLVLLWLSVCAIARRLHDLGHSGWWSLLSLIPVLNIGLGLYLLFAPGQSHFEASSLIPDSGFRSTEPITKIQGSELETSLLPVSDVVITSRSGESEPGKQDPLEEHWAQALRECESMAVKEGLWAKAFSDSGGDEKVAKAHYIRLRATQLHAQYADLQQADQIRREQELREENEKEQLLKSNQLNLLANMSESKRAQASIPKGRCPVCAAVIPLVATQCPQCTALFTEDSSYVVKPLSNAESYEHMQAELNAELLSNDVAAHFPEPSNPKEDGASTVIHLWAYAFLVVLFIMAVFASS